MNKLDRAIAAIKHADDGYKLGRVLSKDRHFWYVKYKQAGSKVEGYLYNDNEFVRAFKVTPKNGEIAVDIGTGSGVKIRFEVEA